MTATISHIASQGKSRVFVVSITPKSAQASIFLHQEFLGDFLKFPLTYFLSFA